MSAISNYLEEALLNAVFRNTAYSSPATVYLALYTSDPTEADTGTEVSGGSYARQAVTFGAPTQVTDKGTIKNSAAIEFPVATADWGVITHIGIRDASTLGNLLYFGALTNSKTILTGEKLTFEIDDLVATLA